MNTATKTTAAPAARNTLKVRTAVRAGYSFGATQTGSSGIVDETIAGNNHMIVVRTIR